MYLLKRNKKIINHVIKSKEIERSPVQILGKDYKVKIIYKNIKIAELDIEKTTIIISLPNKYKKTDNDKILDLAIFKMYESIANVEVERAMEKSRVTLKLAPEEYEIKKTENKLAQLCKDKLIINPEIVKYNRKIIDCIILHEFCHLKYKTHCKKFQELLKKNMPTLNIYEKNVLINLLC